MNSIEFIKGIADTEGMINSTQFDSVRESSLYNRTLRKKSNMNSNKNLSKSEEELFNLK